MSISITFDNLSAFDVGALVALYQMLENEDPIATDIFEYWGYIWDTMREYIIDYVKDREAEGRGVSSDIKQLAIEYQALIDSINAQDETDPGV